LRTANSTPVRKINCDELGAAIPRLEIRKREQQPAKTVSLEERDAIRPRPVVNALDARPVTLGNFLDHQERPGGRISRVRRAARRGSVL
jgi:hypothetical protein